MPREPGTQFGSYVIQAFVGSGGMGEVYRARDQRLNREVALKFLHPDADRERFQREAKVIASLNHPNIVNIYDVGDDYIVTEFIDGRSLRGLKPPLRDAIDWAAQIADGLAAAHCAGITHRDLKPDNVMVTRDGRIKILDFGLAQLARHEIFGESETTRTLAGTIMGTAGYMSPEQVRAQPADARSDIFSFGATVYELLSGHAPFTAPTAVQTMTAVLEKDPPPLPGEVPVGLRRIVERCLEKEPARRFQSAADLAYSLRALSGFGVVPEIRPTIRPRRYPLLPIALGIAILAIAGLVTWRMLRPWEPNPGLYTITPFAVEEYPEFGPAFSPDGQSIAYCAIVAGEYRLMVKNLGGGLPTIVARHPYIPSGFVQLREVTWSADGSRLYYPYIGQAWTVERIGGKPEILKLGSLNAIRSISALAASPDGKGIAFDHGATGSGNRRVYTLWFGPPGGEPSQIPYRDERPLQNLAWSPDSTHLLGTKQMSGSVELVEVGKDGSGKTVLGDEQARSIYSAWLRDNRHAVVSTAPARQGIRMLDTRTRKTTMLLPTTQPVGALSVSPDGSRIAFTMGIARSSIMEVPLDGSAPRAFLGSLIDNSELTWSPDGTEFAYVIGEEIRIRNRAGTAERTVVSRRDFPNFRGSLQFEKPSFSPDGQRLLYTLFGAHGKTQGLWISPVSGGQPASVEKAVGFAPQWTSGGTAVLFNPPLGGIWRYRLGSSEQPEQIFKSMCDPAMSPDGKAFVCPSSPAGMTLVSLETKESRVLSHDYMVNAAFSKDSASLYAIRRKDEAQDVLLIDVATGRARTLFPLPSDFDIRGPFGGPTRLTVSPDGKSLITTIRRNEGDIWILEGLNPPGSARAKF